MVILKKKHIRTCSLLAGGIVAAATLMCKYNQAVCPLQKLHAQVEEEIKFV